MTTENECPICFDTINSTTGSVTLGCSHRYHLKCITTWSLESETCPCCRKVLNSYERVGDVLPEIPSSPVANGGRSGYLVDPWADIPDSVLSDMLDRVEADLAASAARANNSAPELPGIASSNVALITNDSHEQHVAATKIAAVARGFLTRHHLNLIKCFISPYS